MSNMGGSNLALYLKKQEVKNVTDNVCNLDLSLDFETFPIRFVDLNETVEIKFNPKDADLALRFGEMRDRIAELLKTIDDFKMDANGQTAAANAEKLKTVRAAVCDAIDHAFGNKISDKLFSHCSPFAVCGGELFVVQFMHKIVPQIEKRIKEETVALGAAAKKYTDKYAK